MRPFLAIMAVLICCSLVVACPPQLQQFSHCQQRVAVQQFAVPVVQYVQQPVLQQQAVVQYQQQAVVQQVVKPQRSVTRQRLVIRTR